ncbi:response regulator [Halosquirtibacter laminarini]|uniref:Response regulator n=1 Tax=Halosquirtibacter laminarini TaxID=3374600 RepID=A0AC61NBZ4_9BACT|nr:response regulator [Prolixibacteraceae bacterium]
MTALQKIQYKLTVLLLIVFTFPVKGAPIAQFQPLNIDFIRDYGIIPKGIIKGPQGYTWVYNSYNLLRYDGSEVVDFTKKFSKITGSVGIVEIQKKSSGELILVNKKNQYFLIQDNIIKPYPTIINHPNPNSNVTLFRIISDRAWIAFNDGKIYEYQFSNHRTNTFDIPRKKGVANKLIITQSGTIWVATNQHHLFSLKIEDSFFKEKKPLKDYHSGWIVLSAGSLADDIWIGTENEGLFHFNNGKLIQYTKNNRNPKRRIHSNIICTMLNDKYGHIWVGTDGAGLIEFAPNGDIITQSQHQSYNPHSLGSNAVIGLAQVTDKVMWIITNFGKVRTYTPSLPGMKYLYGRKQSSPTRVLNIFIDSKDRVWFGSDGYGIFMKDGDKSIQINIDNHHINGNYVQCIHEDSIGNIWYGTYQSETGYLDKTLKNHTIKLQNEQGVVVKDIRTIFTDAQKNVWIGSNLGLHRINEDINVCDFYSLKTLDMRHSPIIFLNQTKQGNLVVGSGNNLVVIENPCDSIHYKMHNLLNKDGKKIHFNDIAKSDNGSFFIATPSRGILLWNGYLSDSIRVIEDSPTDPVKSIEADSDTVLWLSTDKGIVHHSRITHKNVLWDQTYSEVIPNYRQYSSYKKKNQLYFGGQEGVTSIILDSLKIKPNNSDNSPILINNLLINNKFAEQQIPQQIQNGYNHIDQISIPFSMNEIQVEFSCNNDYREIHEEFWYKLKGLDKRWIRANELNQITYRNLATGDYTLIIEKIGPNKTIIQKKLNIKVLKPSWQKWWAVLIYVILLSSIIFLLMHLFSRWKLLNERLELASWRHNEKEKIFSMKMDFFSKMSHEIQTPLTLIMLPIDEIISKLEDNPQIQKQLKGIKNNASRLSSIAQNMMSVKEKQSKLGTLNKTTNNLKKHLNSTLDAFSEQAKVKYIHLNMDYRSEQEYFDYDRDKMEHVWYNILSNAFKFTPEYGNIYIDVSYNIKKQEVVITIVDNGCGVPSEEKDRIFDMFYQSHHGVEKGGTGIGLALCKDLMQLHQGSIQLAPSNAGATFILRLPQNNTKSQLELFNEETKELSKQFIPSSSEILKNNILIVEDHPEMREYLQSYLSTSYNVEVVANGPEALNKIERRSFDLIISDLEMGSMSGIDLYKILQQNKKTQKIPFAIITANHSKTVRIQALKLGVNEYLQKPFDIEELKLRVDNLIIERKKANTEEDNFLFQHKPNSFTHKLESILNHEIPNGQVSLDHIASKMNLSYSSLYKKTVAETGISPNELLTQKRLKKAESLLQFDEKSIAQIAIECGYADPKYFSKAFKKQYGVSPMNYRRNCNNI